jgi:hypothetical protein
MTAVLRLRMMGVADLGEFSSLLRFPEELSSEKIDGLFSRTNVAGAVVTSHWRRSQRREVKVGFAIYAVNPGYATIHRIVAKRHGDNPGLFYREVMSMLLKHVGHLVDGQGVRQIRAVVPESDLDKLVAFKVAGFFGSIRQKHFQSEDGVLMRYPPSENKAEAINAAAESRISSHVDIRSEF